MTRPGRIRRRTPLRRAALAPGGPLLRRTPLRLVGAKRQRRNGERRRVVALMRAQAGGHCPRCGVAGVRLHGHERRARAHGGDIVRPDVLLCDLCNGWIEDNPIVACWTGWKVSPKHPHDPQLSPSQALALEGTVVEFAIDQAGAA
jgi:hypothetical protein